MNTEPLISITLPFHCKETSVTEVVAEYKKKLIEKGITFELHIVINGCTDQNEERIVRVLEESPRIVEYRLRESGWGRGVLCGLREARGTFVCYTNTARTKIDDLLKFIDYATIDPRAVVKATRVVRESALRKWVSIFYNLENRIILKTPIWDINATPKIIPYDLLARLNLQSLDDLIDAELMFKCFNFGIPVVEVPVVNVLKRRSGRSTTNILSAFKMWLGVFKIRWLYGK